VLVTPKRVAHYASIAQRLPIISAYQPLGGIALRSLAVGADLRWTRILVCLRLDARLLPIVRRTLLLSTNSGVRIVQEVVEQCIASGRLVLAPCS